MGRGGEGAIMEIKGIKPLRSWKPKRHSDCCLRKAKQKLGYHTLKRFVFHNLCILLRNDTEQGEAPWRGAVPCS